MTDRLRRLIMAPTTKPGADEAVSKAPILGTRPTIAVHGPIDFAATYDDGTGPKADRLRRSITGVRFEVFIAEQAVPLTQETNARDEEPTTIHLLASGAGETPLGVGRLLVEPERPGQIHLGHLAVRNVVHSTRLGTRIVAALEQTALSHFGQPRVEMVLPAQEQTVGFYERYGYWVLNDHHYFDTSIWHQDIARIVNSISTEDSSGRAAQTGHWHLGVHARADSRAERRHS